MQQQSCHFFLHVQTCRQLGEGGFGSVRVVRSKTSGAEFACKSICKRLDVPNLPPIKQQQHLENIQREVLILRKLRGTLNVVHLEVGGACRKRASCAGLA
jgi:serine/threonine protein kinase